MEQVPLVDVRDLATDPVRFGQRVCGVMKEWGFLAVVGHGMSEDILSPARAATKKYLAQDPIMLEERYGRPALFRQRGVSINMEKAVGHSVVDDKIFDMIRIEEDPDDPADNPFGPNVWPDDLVPEYRPAVQVVMREQVKCGRQVLRGVEIGRGFPEGYLVNMTYGSETVLRPIYYPPVQGRVLPPGTMRSAKHRDINMLSVLPPTEAHEEGLELLINGEVIPAPPRSGVSYMNTGMMLAEIRTFGEFAHLNVDLSDLTPTEHQVRMPDGEAQALARVMLALFLHARRSVMLNECTQCGPWLDEVVRKITVG